MLTLKAPGSLKHGKSPGCGRQVVIALLTRLAKPGAAAAAAKEPLPRDLPGPLHSVVFEREEGFILWIWWGWDSLG